MKSSISVSASKRTKHVFSSHEIPHLWAHKVQSEARNSTRNLFFQDETIYSYGSHFPIARHYSNKQGEACILFTTASYSNTTAKHLHHVRMAIPDSILTFNVPFVLLDTFRDTHQLNLKDYVSRIEAAIIKSARGRKAGTKESEHDSAVAMSADAKAYAKFFRVPCPALPNVPELNSIEMDAVRKREARLAAERAEETKKREAENRKREAERIERWRNGEDVGYLPYDTPTMLRLRWPSNVGANASDDYQVETSRGVRVPLSHAKRALAFVRQIVASGQEWRTNGHTFKVGEYAVQHVEANGTLHAGCHVIAYAEIERIAPSLEAIA